MKVGILGTGVVGRTLGVKLMALGHDVVLGTRDVAALLARSDPGGRQPPFSDWLRQHPDARVGRFEEAASHGEVVFNATAGSASLDALRQAGSVNLARKILVDVSNPLDASGGMPPTLAVCNTDSLAEQIQRAFPDTRVVKTLNTVNARVMVDPGAIGQGEHHVFVSGDDAAARAEVTAMLKDWFGWKHVADLGDISTARGPGMYLPLWLRLVASLGTPAINIQVVR